MDVAALSCMGRRRALWNTEGETASSQVAVERIAAIVSEERGMLVFSDEREATDGANQTWIYGWDGYKTWMIAGDHEAEASHTFELTVTDGRC